MGLYPQITKKAELGKCHQKGKSCGAVKVLEQTSLPSGLCHAQLQPELTVILLTRYISFNRFPRRSRYGELLTRLSTTSEFPLYQSPGKRPSPLTLVQIVAFLPEPHWTLKNNQLFLLCIPQSLCFKHVKHFIIIHVPVQGPHSTVRS